MKWGAKRKWGKAEAAPADEPVRMLLGVVVMHDGDPHPWVRTTRRGYAYLWAFGCRGRYAL